MVVIAFVVLLPRVGIATWWKCFNLSRAALPWTELYVATTKFPRGHVPTAYPAHEAALERQGIGKRAALDRADKLQADVDDLIVMLRNYHGDDIDRVLKGAFKKIRAKAFLEGTGYVVFEENPTMTPISDITEWIRTSEDVDSHFEILARRSQTHPGYVTLANYQQRVNGAVIPRLETRDLNTREWYVQIFLLSCEELYHIVHYLRLYGGLMGPEVNVSTWARNSREPIFVHLEADVFARLMETFGALPSQWRRVHSTPREAVPILLPLYRP